MAIVDLIEAYQQFKEITRLEEDETQSMFWGENTGNKDYDIYEKALDTALDNWKLSVEGYSFNAWLKNNIGSTTGITFRPNSKSNPAIPIEKLGMESAVGFDRIFITAPAQAGVTLQVFVGRMKGTRGTYVPKTGGGSGSGGITNKGDWQHSHPTITAAGTAEQLPNLPIPDGFKGAICNPPDNTGFIYYGKTKAEAESLTDRVPLDVGEADGYFVTNFNLFYYDAQVTGEGPILKAEK
jgi:hypothetical protein